jgi:hypothetical protein
MIDIRYKHLKWFGYFVAITGGSAVIVRFGGFGDKWFQDVCFGYLMILAILGIIAPILERFGIVRFRYSDTERHSRMYKMSSNCANAERQIWGKIFSDTYYENYLEDDENKK